MTPDSPTEDEWRRIVAAAHRREEQALQALWAVVESVGGEVVIDMRAMMKMPAYAQHYLQQETHPETGAVTIKAIHAPPKGKVVFQEQP